MTRAFQKPLGVLAYYWSEEDDSVDRAHMFNFPFHSVNYLEWAEWSGIFYKKHGYKEYVQKDEDLCRDLKPQVAFLKKIGRLNNGEKDLVWKTITER